MELVFTKHTIERMEQRRVTFVEIMECLENPDKIEKEEIITRFFKVNFVQMKLLIVVCCFYDDYCTIVTVIKTSRLKRYLN